VHLKDQVLGRLQPLKGLLDPVTLLLSFSIPVGPEALQFP
jgi:hypothetical protein